VISENKACILKEILDLCFCTGQTFYYKTKFWIQNSLSIANGGPTNKLLLLTNHNQWPYYEASLAKYYGVLW
jgi:hypothetical protein